METFQEAFKTNSIYLVPFSHHRPYALQYQVRETTTNKPKPLSDEFSNEFTASGENYSGNNRWEFFMLCLRLRKEA